MTFRDRFSKQVHGVQVPWHEHDPGDIAGQVASRFLAVASVVTSKIADLAVTTAKLADAAVTDAKVAFGIDGAKLANGTVDTPELADGSVTTPKIAAAAVTDGKVAFGIDGAKLADGTVDTAELADASVTGPKLNITGSDLPDHGVRHGGFAAADMTIGLDSDGPVSFTENSVAFSNRQSLTTTSLEAGSYWCLMLWDADFVAAADTGRTDFKWRFRLEGVDRNPVYDEQSVSTVTRHVSSHNAVFLSHGGGTVTVALLSARDDGAGGASDNIDVTSAVLTFLAIRTA